MNAQNCFTLIVHASLVGAKEEILSKKKQNLGSVIVV